MPILDLNYVYWDSVKQAKVVGWPLPTAEQPLWAYQRIAAAAPQYKSAGFNATLFMPSTLGAGGDLSDGYDIKDNYTFDGTSWGSGSLGQSAVKTLHAQGIKVFGDLVLHQMDGYAKQQYTTKQFPKDSTCFAWDSSMGTTKYPGNKTPDWVPDSSGGWPDGDLCAYQPPNCYMWDGAIAAALNQIDFMGFDGFRIDEAKDLNTPFLCALLDALRAKYPNLWACGEYFDGNPAALLGWIGYWMNYRAKVFDFQFKFNIGKICNNNSNSWMGAIGDLGVCLQNGENAVTFVENADTDTTIGEQTIWNKQLGYDIMFSLPGDPMVYYRDWSSDRNCYGMSERINNGLWRWHNLAQGSFVTRNAAFQTFVCERLGYGSAPGCVCFFNNNQWSAETVTVQTRYPSGTRLHEYTGNAGYSADKWTDYWGRITVTIPRNVNGLNSLVYAPYI